MSLELTMQQLVHRDHMERLMDRCYSAISRYGHDSIQAKQANAEYDAWAKKGDPSWHCSITDPDMWSSFSDAHKELYNFRPRAFLTRERTEVELKNVRCQLELEMARSLEQEEQYA